VPRALRAEAEQTNHIEMSDLYQKTERGFG
jgi:hypothetical protein